MLFKNTCSYVNVYLREIRFRNLPPRYIRKLNCNKMDKHSFLADVGKIVATFEKVDVAYLFGSFLERDEFNDIDVALLLSE